MKCFRVWPDGRVDDCIPFAVLDNVGYVPVGGTDMSYITLDSALAARFRKDGGVPNAIVEEMSGTKVRLFAEKTGTTDENLPRQALVLLPSKAAFQFTLVRNSKEPRSACRYSNDRVALLAILDEGDILTATPRARTISELETSATHVITFDGERVTVETRNKVALAA